MNITMQGKYQTRDGRAVRILCTDLRAGATCILGLIAVADDEEMVGVWAADGRAFPWRTGNPNDLIPVSTKHKGWLVISKQENPVIIAQSRVFHSNVEADSYRIDQVHPEDFTVVKIEWEV
jgi:hypothetical protein